MPALFVAAVWNDTPCFGRLILPFLAAHAKTICIYKDVSRLSCYSEQRQLRFQRSGPARGAGRIRKPWSGLNAPFVSARQPIPETLLTSSPGKASRNRGFTHSSRRMRIRSSARQPVPKSAEDVLGPTTAPSPEIRPAKSPRPDGRSASAQGSAFL